MKEERRDFWRNARITFITIFLSNAFVIATSFSLFFHSLHLDTSMIQNASIVTFVNVILLTILFMSVHMIRNYITVTRPVRKIQQGLREITNGNFSVRIAQDGYNAPFDTIIESINRMTEELSTVETLKTDFISNVSHELKTPIAVIHNYSRLLESDSLTEAERKEYVRIISDTALSLSTLISNILKLNRLENQQILPGSASFDLGGQVTECLLGFESVWEEKDIQIEADIQDEVMIHGDKELLSIVWNNLLSNAFKFTEPGGKVSVTMKTEGEMVFVSIQDTGCGISPEAGRHIFDKFYQGDTSHSTQGNGLGLALVKRIIDIIGGSIAVKSIPGEGSTFTIGLNRGT